MPTTDHTDPRCQDCGAPAVWRLNAYTIASGAFPTSTVYACGEHVNRAADLWLDDRNADGLGPDQEVSRLGVERLEPTEQTTPTLRSLAADYGTSVNQLRWALELSNEHGADIPLRPRVVAVYRHILDNAEWVR